MNELSRSLLAAAREGMTPDAAVMARVRAKVAAQIAPPPPPPASAAVAVKVGIAAVTTLGAIVAAVIATRSHAIAVEAPRVAVAPVESEPAPAEVQLAAPEAAPSPPTIEVQQHRVAPAEPTLQVAPVPAREPATLSREVELIDRAMLSLNQHDAGAALEAIATFERETFGRGQMAEEAAAIQIEAHCRLHDDVTAPLAEFDRKWPSSAQRDRIQSACFKVR